MTALVLDQLRKSYTAAGQAALQGLNLKVESGSLTALLGPSGSGKTTTMKLIAGLIAPDAGDIRLEDRSIRDLPPERRGVAMVFQNPLLFPHLTVAGNVGFGLRMRGSPEDKIAASVRDMLDRVHLADLAQRKPVQLSGGQAQRVALARALVLRPNVLLLDEPLSSLDPGLRDDMRQLIRALQRDTGITTIVVTHDQTEAVALADHIALLLEGKLVQHGAPQAFYARPATEAVARFFGGVNFMPGTVRSGTFDCDLGPLSLPPGLADGPGLLTIRPESLRLGQGPNSRTAQIASLTFLGNLTQVDLVVSGKELRALVTPDNARSLVPGTEITLSLPPDALWVLPVDRSPPPPR